MDVWRILVPTIFEDTHIPVRVAHHREWDRRVRALAGGLTIFKPTVKGEWIDPNDGELYTDRTIPVEIVCNRDVALRIAEITKAHYRQKAVLIYRVSDDAIFI